MLNDIYRFGNNICFHPNNLCQGHCLVFQQTSTSLHSELVPSVACLQCSALLYYNASKGLDQQFSLFNKDSHQQLVPTGSIK